MSKFLPYSPDQAALLPASVKDVLSSDHICFFVHRAVEKLNLRVFEDAYGEEGRRAYAPALMLKVWLYGYLLGVTSSRRLEQRIREDLAFRYLAGGATPDYWALNDFLRRHRRAINDVFTQVLEIARGAGLVKLGHVAIDSTRVAANASRHRVDSEQGLRQQRARLRKQVRAWQRRMQDQDPDEGAGTSLAGEQVRKIEQQLEQIPQRLQHLKKSKQRQLSQSDREARFLRESRGYTLGYTGELAVDENHLIVAQRVTQNATDNDSLAPMVEQVKRECGSNPVQVSADTAFFSAAGVEHLEQQGIDAYVPDVAMARELKGGGRASSIGNRTIHHPTVLRMREKLRQPEGRRAYARRKNQVEPVFGILKEQRGLRRFRRRGLAAVSTEWTMAAVAYNLGRLYAMIGN
jgi:transposase